MSDTRFHIHFRNGDVRTIGPLDHGDHHTAAALYEHWDANRGGRVNVNTSNEAFEVDLADVVAMNFED